MNLSGHDIGVCSWSLHPKDMADLIAMVKQVGLSHIQLGMLEYIDMPDDQRTRELAQLRDSGIAVTAGMIGFPGEDYSTIAMIRHTGGYVSDETFAARRQMTIRAAQLCADMGVKKLSSHVGFVPASSNRNYEVMLQRIGELAASLGDMGIQFGFETGQEPAPELLQFLNDLSRKNIFINFDPANMILYGAGDPIEAVRTLGRHIGHVHCKDATLSDQPGTAWGKEVPFGEGQVNVPAFIAALKQVAYTGPLVIEREAGTNRLADVKFAIESLKSALK